VTNLYLNIVNWRFSGQHLFFFITSCGTI